MNVGKSRKEDDACVKLALELTLELTEREQELAEELSTKIVQEHKKMSELEKVLRAIRVFRRKTADSLYGILEDLKMRNTRIYEAEG